MRFFQNIFNFITKFKFFNATCKRNYANIFYKSIFLYILNENLISNCDRTNRKYYYYYS